MTARRDNLSAVGEEHRVIRIDPCSGCKDCPHITELTRISTPRQFGLTLEDALLGILCAPFDADRISRETLEQAVKESE